MNEIEVFEEYGKVKIRFEDEESRIYVELTDEEVKDLKEKLLEAKA